MERIYIHGSTYEFPDADFGDLTVLEVIENAADLCRCCKEDCGGTPMEQLARLRDCGLGMMAQLDRVLGEGACARMFGSRINLTELTEVFRQLLEGFQEAIGWCADELDEA